MANMRSYTVQYLIKARDEFSKAATKARESSKTLRQDIRKTKESFVNASAGMRRAGTVMTAAITTPLAFAAFSLKNAARDAEETRSKFATVFKDIGAEAQAAADNLSKSFGLGSTQARQLLGDTGDILTGFGFTQEAALDLSKQVNELAVDLASFTNYQGGAEGASQALVKALLGEAESVKALGIVIRQDTPEYKNLVGAIMQTQGVSLVQAKALAALKIATVQSKNAIGDFARTQEQLANQERITSARLKDVKEAFGRLLLPVALKVTQAFRSLLEGLLALSPGMKTALLVIAGVAAAMGPLVLAAGSLVLIWPAVTAAMGVFGAVAAAALGPLLPVIAAVAAGATLIASYWGELKAFFSGFADGLSRSLGPTLGVLVEDFKEAAGVIVSLFGGDSEATKSLEEFTNAGQLMGEIIGGTISKLVQGLGYVGKLLGQFIAATVSLDFTKFDFDAIKAEFTGAAAQPVRVDSNLNVGLNVGLAPGLQQTEAPSISSSGVRRTDVGAQ